MANGKLKVYGWGSHRGREIVAVPSKAAAARAAGEEDHRRLWNMTETGNAIEIEYAMQAPGVVFWQPSDQHLAPYHRMDGGPNLVWLVWVNDMVIDVCRLESIALKIAMAWQNTPERRAWRWVTSPPQPTRKWYCTEVSRLEIIPREIREAKP